MSIPRFPAVPPLCTHYPTTKPPRLESKRRRIGQGWPTSTRYLRNALRRRQACRAGRTVALLGSILDGKSDRTSPCRNTGLTDSRPPPLEDYTQSACLLSASLSSIRVTWGLSKLSPSLHSILHNQDISLQSAMNSSALVERSATGAYYNFRESRKGWWGTHVFPTDECTQPGQLRIATDTFNVARYMTNTNCRSQQQPFFGHRSLAIGSGEQEVVCRECLFRLLCQLEPIPGNVHIDYVKSLYRMQTSILLLLLPSQLHNFGTSCISDTGFRFTVAPTTNALTSIFALCFLRACSLFYVTLLLRTAVDPSGGPDGQQREKVQGIEPTQLSSPPMSSRPNTRYKGKAHVPVPSPPTASEKKVTRKRASKKNSKSISDSEEPGIDVAASENAKNTAKGRKASKKQGTSSRAPEVPAQATAVKKKGVALKAPAAKRAIISDEEDSEDDPVQSSPSSVKSYAQAVGTPPASRLPSPTSEAAAPVKRTAQRMIVEVVIPPRRFAHSLPPLPHHVSYQACLEHCISRLPDGSSWSYG
ncbi:hypothetical protein NMY22_g17599 [Coprinellus aureogranulatus]|nr:hypothetical protein NMY22_g17599 [Coprinellus aureogranulatus]